jgi:alpha-galactosidase
MGAQLTLEKTLDRRESLKGADFVINTALVAGHDRLAGGWEVGSKHGYRIGGSLHIMHDEAFWVNWYQYRLFESIIQDILEICPDAWYLQVANPVLAGITWLGRKYPQAKIVGLCHGFGGVYQIIDQLGFDRAHTTFEIPGVNHFVWLTKLFYKGEDALPLLDRWVAEKAPAYWETNWKSDQIGPGPVELYKQYRAFPIGDTCTPGGGSWPYWYHSDDATEAQWREDPRGWWFNEYLPGLEKHLAHLKAVSEDAAHPVSEAFPPKHSGEVMVPLIEAIACDLPRELIVNIPNRGGYVPGIPHDFEVEVPALCSARGIQGIQTDGLPAPVLAWLLRDRVAPVETELLAYETGDRALLYQLALMDPFTRSLSQARALVDEVLALPFNAEMRAHFA